jgi:hypothetical protein
MVTLMARKGDSKVKWQSGKSQVGSVLSTIEISHQLTQSLWKVAVGMIVGSG